MTRVGQALSFGNARFQPRIYPRTTRQINHAPFCLSRPLFFERRVAGLPAADLPSPTGILAGTGRKFRPQRFRGLNRVFTDATDFNRGRRPGSFRRPFDRRRPLRSGRRAPGCPLQHSAAGEDWSGPGSLGDLGDSLGKHPVRLRVNRFDGTRGRSPTAVVRHTLEPKVLGDEVGLSPLAILVIISDTASWG